MSKAFHDNLKEKIDKYVHLIYKITKKFPKEELYGVVSQFRRAALSIILNYIEGYARFKRLVRINFFEISYGSLKESQYLLKFSLDEGYLTDIDYNKINNLGEEIGAMLWQTLDGLKQEK